MEILSPSHQIRKKRSKGFSPEQAKRICDLIQSGLTLRQTAAKESISAALIIWNRNHDEEFAKHYARALEIRTENDFEGLIDLAFENPVMNKFGLDPAWVNLKRLQIDTIKWALSKRNPKKYGEKMQLEHGLESSLAARLDSARKRLESGD